MGSMDARNVSKMINKCLMSISKYAKDWPKWDKHDVIIASNDGLMLTVHSQTSHPLDTILRSK